MKKTIWYAVLIAAPFILGAAWILLPLAFHLGAVTMPIAAVLKANKPTQPVAPLDCSGVFDRLSRHLTDEQEYACERETPAKAAQ